MKGKKIERKKIEGKMIEGIKEKKGERGREKKKEIEEELNQQSSP